MKEFEISIPYVSNTKKVVYFTFLVLVLLINVVLINKNYANENNSLAYDNFIGYVQTRSINIYKENDIYIANTDNMVNPITSYECMRDDCKVVEVLDDSVIIYDENYFIYDIVNETTKPFNVIADKDQEFTFVNNYVVINNHGKYALFNILENNYVTEYIYDGYTNKSFDDNGIVSLFINDSKYNQLLDIYNDNKEVIKHYDYCNSLATDTDNGYCSEHVKGNITNEEVDNYIDIVLTQYPDLNDVRLFTIKTGMETVGLPYFWGGGHLSLKNTLETATSTWNNDMCIVGGNGFKNQLAGQEYPCGFDCSGFVRWVYYTATGIDIMGKGVSVIGGRDRHPDYTQITEEELQPGDLIMDKDHVVIYLYKNEEGKHISVHASFDHLQVEVSNYKRGNQYYRLNAWNE